MCRMKDTTQKIKKSNIYYILYPILQNILNKHFLIDMYKYIKNFITDIIAALKECDFDNYQRYTSSISSYTCMKITKKA